MKLKIFNCLLIACFLFTGCKKEFLNKKPSSAILSPTSLDDLNGLLERVLVFNRTGVLPQISADEYSIISDQAYNSLNNATQRNAYIWAKDIYQGESANDWDNLFRQIFVANNVLEIIDNGRFENSKNKDITKGWALFNRAYAYYDLALNFCPVYNEQSLNTDLGLPIRLKPGVEYIVQRSSLKVTFDQILKDLDQAGALLNPFVPELNRNRPSKAAVYALKSRIYLYQGKYDYAETYVDSALTYHNRLINYNTVSQTSTTPFGYNAEEVIYQSQQGTVYTISGYDNQLSIDINPELIKLYQADDLRKAIFYRLNASGKYNMKRGYVGGTAPFTGLAVDELYLIKAECLARLGQPVQAMDWLNRLLINRFKTGSFIPLSASTPEEALKLILAERQKELVWRSARWPDLKRQNRDGANINLSRTINGTNHTLPANDQRWVFPIPDQEIASSGIIQNSR